MNPPANKPEAVILGNGPSLRGFDFRRLSRFDVFGMNAAYRYWYEIGWFPQYYSCLDLVVGASHRDAIIELIRNADRLGIRGFLLRQKLIKELGKTGATPKVFNFDALRPGHESWATRPLTTGSHTCAWASILGYKDIYLLGIDCNYVEFAPNAERRDGTVLEITGDAPNPNYFFDSYQQKGDRYNIPNPRKDLHLDSWRNVGGEIAGQSRVLNANFASRVDAFPFVRFEDIEKTGRAPVYSPEAVLNGSPLPEANEYVLVPSGAAATADSSGKALALNNPADVNKDSKSESRLSRHGSVLAYDADWRYPAITEKHAFTQGLKFLPDLPSAVYFAFPWATLIDQLDKKGPADRLLGVLADAKAGLKGHKHVITVCQHINMLRRQPLFARAGITHMFWSHAVRGQERFPKYPDIRIHPFPLYPVQTLERGREAAGRKRYLFSLVGVRPNQRYLTEVRSHIIDHHNIVSPNSMHLWETIGCGAIPVILSDNYLPPGNDDLWNEAAVFCPERLEEVLALPDKLEALARDESLLERKRHALRQLWMLYGPDCFIYDIQKQFLSLAGEASGAALERPAFSYGPLLGMAAEINRTMGAEPLLCNIFILGCTSRVLAEPAAFLMRYEENDLFRLACRRALSSCGRTYSESMRKALAARGVVLDGCNTATAARAKPFKDNDRLFRPRPSARP